MRGSIPPIPPPLYNKYMEKYIKNGEVGIVTCDHCEMGWSTANPIISTQLLFDRELVDMVLSETCHKIILEYCEKKYGKGNYIPGVFHLNVTFLPIGTHFQVEQLCGGEMIVIHNPEDIHIA